MDFPNKSKFLISFVEILLTNLLLFNFSSKCLCCLNMLCMSITPTCTGYMHILLSHLIVLTAEEDQYVFPFVLDIILQTIRTTPTTTAQFSKCGIPWECGVCLCLFVDIYRMFLIWACHYDTMFTIFYCTIFNHNNSWICLLCSVPSCYEFWPKYQASFWMILDVVANGDKPHQQKTIIRSYEHWHNKFWRTKIVEANIVKQKIDMHLLSL